MVFRPMLLTDFSFMFPFLFVPWPFKSSTVVWSRYLIEWGNSSWVAGEVGASTEWDRMGLGLY